MFIIWSFKISKTKVQTLCFQSLAASIVKLLAACFVLQSSFQIIVVPILTTLSCEIGLSLFFSRLKGVLQNYLLSFKMSRDLGEYQDSWKLKSTNTKKVETFSRGFYSRDWWILTQNFKVSIRFILLKLIMVSIVLSFSLIHLLLNPC